MANHSSVKYWKRSAVRGLKLLLAGLILVMVTRSLMAVSGDLLAYGETLRPSIAWLTVSAGLYLLGLGCFGVFFGRILKRSATPIGAWAAQRAYLIGHLGKYVPGKAMVVVLRVGLTGPYGARTATAAFATLYETLVMMASGGLLAGLLFLVWPGPPIDLPVGGGRGVSVPLALLALGIGLPLLVLADARIFPKLAMAASLPFPGVGREALPTFSVALLIEGLACSLIGWTLLGMSLVATIQAIEPGVLPLSSWPLSIAAVALATVSGFLVAVFPGGLVIREAVLTAALGSVLWPEAAIVSALVLRLVWGVAELLGSAVVALLRPKRPDPESLIPMSAAASGVSSSSPGLP